VDLRATRSRMGNRAMAVFIACFFTVLAAYSIRYSYGTLMPEMLPDLDITKAQAGSIYASYFFAYTLFSPIIGRLADRYSIRLIISFFDGHHGLGTFLMQYGRPCSGRPAFFFGLSGWDAPRVGRP